MHLKNKTCHLLFMFCQVLSAQVFNEPQDLNIPESMQETADESIDFSELIPEWQTFNRPFLNLNKASYADLNSLNCLSQIQIQNLLNHRKLYGAILSVYELQTIESFDLTSIRNLLPFVELKLNFLENVDKKQTLNQQMSLGLSQRTERSIGYTKKDSTQFQGSPWKYQIRYETHYGKSVNFGFHAEKDAGETYKILFYSAFLNLKFKGLLKNILLGDQKISLGQGLLIGSGLSIGKSAAVMQVMKNNNGASAYKSFNETGFIRGLSIQLETDSKLKLIAFGGFRSQDAVVNSDSNSTTIGSINQSGTYRNITELNRRHTLKSSASGIYVQKTFNSLEWGIGTVYTVRNLNSDSSTFPLYKKYVFNTSQNIKLSSDFKWQYKQMLAFGEVALSNLKAKSMLTGLLLAIGHKTDLSLLYRNYSKAFDGSLSNAFSENAGTSNENGLFTGLSTRLLQGMQINLYTDVMHSKWLRYRVNGPSTSAEQFCEIKYEKRNSLLLSLRLRSVTKQYNNSETSHLKTLEEQRKQSIRIHLEYQNGRFRMRSRAEQCKYTIQNGKTTFGSLFYQDLQVVFNQQIKLSVRYTVFDTEDYNSRCFAFENGMPGSYNITSYNGKGFRYYFLLQYHVNKELQIWFKFARSKYPFLEALGTGLDLIKANHHSDFNLLLQWKIQHT